ncbi:hypothetical protein W02_13570 [Nitrospira sp. KM1]|uniref:glycosyltransferase n=1 Tax=Nitrospira sp. KM1 TaxID=1936990 RepID=UPI0013A7555A|nr:glycosyltransferase [Nitrospira sp. KM1]BCA54217.1 hypothetical protein W02_13570 [Nitrospira sp. KM1]
MKIVIFGNTNNSPLLLAEGLRTLGHNVILLVNRRDLLHRPETRFAEYRRNGYPSWILDYSHVTDEDIACDTGALDDVLHQLTEHVDLVVLNDVGPALSSYLKAPHVVFLTGSDLSYYSNFCSVLSMSHSWSKQFSRSIQGRRQIRRMTDLISRQRNGIASARIVCTVPRGAVPEGDGLLDAIGVTDEQRMPLHLSNVHGLKPRPLGEGPTLRILGGSRIVFRAECHQGFGQIDFKGTDVLLSGFAEYVRRGGKGELTLIEKGQDVGSARHLIKELNIGARTRWLQEMPMHEFYEAMSAADLVCDQFGSSVPGMVTTDAYALGRPVLCNFRNEIFAPYYPKPFPGFTAVTKEDVAQHLLAVEQNRASLEQMARESRDYAEQYLAPEKVAERLLQRCGYGNTSETSQDSVD